MSQQVGKVYKIVCGLSDDVYIGSTFNELKHRFQGHKKGYKRCTTENKRVLYQLFDKYGIDNFKIILIKQYMVCDRSHLRMYEQLWINKTKCINMVSAFGIDYLTIKQYRIKNKDKIKHYKINNKDKIRESGKKYYIKNKDKSKQYYDDHKDKILNYHKQYQQKLPITKCECGALIKGGLSKHKKTLKHKQYLNK